MLKNKSEYEIGNKLEEAYCSKQLQEEPSEETVAKWIAIAEQRRAERRRRNHKLISCAAALLMCVCVGVTCAINKPNAVAGSTGGNKVEVGMETVDIYTSYDELPDDVKSDFLMFAEMPIDYDLEEIRVEKNNNMNLVYLTYKNGFNEVFYVSQMRTLVEGKTKIELNDYTVKETWGGTDVYIKEYRTGDCEVIYMFENKGLLVKICTTKNVDYSKVRDIIEKNVRL